MTKIAAQLYTLRDQMKTPKEIAQGFEKLSKIGYEVAQVSGIGPIDATELRRIADANGIRLLCTHIPYDRMKNEFDQVVEEHHIMGCDYVGVGAVPNWDKNTGADYVHFAKEYDEIAKKFKKEGLTATYHNHAIEFAKFDGKLAMDLLLENSSAFSFLLDTYWVQAGGGDVVDWIYKLKGRMEIIHFKDMSVQGNAPIMAEVMEGNLNWPAILKACQDLGIKYYIVEQDICQRDPFESLKISYENLKNAGVE